MINMSTAPTAASSSDDLVIPTGGAEKHVLAALRYAGDVLQEYARDPNEDRLYALSIAIFELGHVAVACARTLDLLSPHDNTL